MIIRPSYEIHPYESISQQGNKGLFTPFLVYDNEIPDLTHHFVVQGNIPRQLIGNENTIKWGYVGYNT